MTVGRQIFSMIIIVLSVLFFITPLTAANEAERLWITGDGVFSFDGHIWIAVGGVKVVQGDTTITADRMLYHPDDEEVLLEGDVRIVRGGEIIDGESLAYDVTKGKGALSEAVMQFEAEISREMVYLLGDMIEFEDDLTVIHDARFTTCTPPKTAGYYLLSKRVDIFPGERIVIRNVRFVESGLTLFYWPYLSISLREDRSTRIKFPEIGYNEEDGFYIKLNFPYDGPGDGFGDVEVEFSQFGGTGAGVNHIYRLEKDSEGKFSIYGKSGGRYGKEVFTATWNETFPINESLKAALTGLSHRTTDMYGVMQSELKGTAQLRHRLVGQSTEFDLAVRRRSTLGGQLAIGTRLNHTRTISSLRLRGQVDYFHHIVAGDPVKDSFGYIATANDRTKGITWKLESERRIHSSLMREDSTATPAWRTFLRPIDAEATFTLRDLISNRLPIKLGVGFGTFYEERRQWDAGQSAYVYNSTLADRRGFTFGVVPEPIFLGSFGRLTYSGDAVYQTYSTGEERVIYSVNHQYRLPLGARGSFVGTYTLREIDGDESPFIFDRMSDRESVSGRLQYIHPQGSASMTAGYNLKTQRASDLLAQMSYRPTDRLSVQLQGGYSIENRKPTYAAGNVRYIPVEGLRLSASSRYDFAHARWSRITAELAANFAGWGLEYNASYDGYYNEIDFGRLRVSRDLDCREIAVRYDISRGAAWFEYVISAFPQVPIGFGFDDEKFQFDTDPWFNLFR